MLDINIERTVPSGEVIRRAVCFRSWLCASWSFLRPWTTATRDICIPGHICVLHGHAKRPWTTVATNCTLPTTPTGYTYRLHLPTTSTEPDRTTISSGSGRDEGQFHCSQVLSPRRTGQNHHFIRFSFKVCDRDMFIFQHTRPHFIRFNLSHPIQAQIFKLKNLVNKL